MAASSVAAARGTPQLDHMLATGTLFDDEGLLSFGPEGEKSFGYRNFLELFSVFTTPPLFAVLEGAKDIGQVHPSSFQARKGALPTLLLGGRSWIVKHIDWERRLAYVEAIRERGRSRWPGEGRALGFELCRAIRRVLLAGSCPGDVSRRAGAKLEELADAFAWLDDTGTAVVREGFGERRWWTFAGLRANLALAEATGVDPKAERHVDNLCIPLDSGVDVDALREMLPRLRAEEVSANVPIPEGAAEGLKFAKCLTPELANRVMTERWADAKGVDVVLGERLRSVAVQP